MRRLVQLTADQDHRLRRPGVILHPHRKRLRPPVVAHPVQAGPQLRNHVPQPENLLDVARLSLGPGSTILRGDFRQLFLRVPKAAAHCFHFPRRKRDQRNLVPDRQLEKL